MSNNNSGKVEDVFKDFEKSDPPWASKNAQYQYEAIKKVLLPMLEAYISSKVNEARIDELERHISWNHPAGGITLTRREVDDRIRTLKKTGGADEQEQ